ncbi:hypothetical protein D3C84_771930 [compost metagenome]
MFTIVDMPEPLPLPRLESLLYASSLLFGLKLSLSRALAKIISASDLVLDATADFEGSVLLHTRQL